MKKRKIRKHPYKFSGRSIQDCLLPELDTSARSGLEIMPPRVYDDGFEIFVSELLHQTEWIYQ